MSSEEIFDRTLVLEAIFQQRTRFMAILAIDGTVLDVNNFCLEFTGVSREQVIGKKFWQAPWCDTLVVTQKLVQEEIGHTLRTGTVIQGEAEYTIADGSVRYGTYAITPLKQNHQITHLLVESEDITDRRQHDVTIQQRLLELETIYDTAPIGLCFQDTNLRYVRINGTLAEINGVSIEDHLGRTLHEAIPVVADALEPIFRRVLETGEPLLNQELRLATQGQPDVLRDWLASYVAVKNSSGEVLGVNVTVQEMTQLRRAEADRDRFFTLSLDMLAIANFDGYLLKTNPAWTEILGWSEAELTSQPYLNFVHLEDVELTIAEAQRLSEGQPVIEFENRYRCKDGSYRWLSWTVGSFPEEQRLYAVAHNITERKQIELARLRVADEREALLRQEQAAREAAETANRIKDEFLAVLSHELRTPLNPILGWSKLLQRNVTDPNLMRGLETIERNAKLQVQLIDDLLDVSRILRGKLVLHQTPVSLAAVIRAALETVELAAQVKSIDITIEMAPDLGTVLGDAGRLQQVAWNLLTNAVKFTPEGGKITVRLARSESMAFLQVSDTGKGISSDFVPFVFESFRQEDNATTRKFGGLGLGLAIARQLVEMHGGTIKVESLGEGQGATFTVILPLN
ncbi:sensor histidine kinase [Leptolyngbya sp. NIES-2104]|uniref:sensor histidine kinase n=1 Tax=Leptolyngbya sp. NIES-2104 TaxID=1552121 RepID=UPI0006EC81FA|nr:PAS domain S-box protein [Leptolyngbya sp. NIES-2104]GAP98747.1 two-component hybrid sensor and regulator [Leptolyngbya sp. NIES-2104]